MRKLTLVGTIAGAALVTVLTIALATPGLAGAGASGLYITATPSRTPYTSPLPPDTRTPSPEPVVPGSITVVGVGKVTVVPNVVKIQVGVESISTTVAAATTENDKVMDAVLAALKEEGIAEKDIQTSYYSIHPEYERDRVGSETELPKIIGYRVSNSVTVTVRDAEDMRKVSAVLEAVVEAGANSLGSITFTVDDLQAVEDEARELAVADAKRRAEDLVRLTGVKLGRVIQISEVITGPPTIARQEVAPVSLGGGPSIMPGEQEYGVSIQITYAIW